MNTLKIAPNRYPFRLLVATMALALSAGLAQTANAQPHEGHGGPGMGMMGIGPGMGAPHQMGRMLDAVGATDEQRSQIRQIMQGAMGDLRGQREAGRKLHQDMQALFTQPTVDARAVEALRQQMLAQHDQASKRMMQAMLDTSRVLTVEQRKTLADRMAQRRSMMDRHRTERDTLDKPAR
jgi:Spy/CpxP family protein refolding chaperone